MKIEFQPHPDHPEIIRITLAGRLDTGGEAEIAPQMLQAVEHSGIGVILDLAQVDFISSAGLRLLVQAYKNLTAKGKKLAMIRAQPAVYKIFKLAAFEAAFNLQQDDASALETFPPPQPSVLLS